MPCLKPEAVSPTIPKREHIRKKRVGAMRADGITMNSDSE